jgi:hypothetical protein
MRFTIQNPTATTASGTSKTDTWLAKYPATPSTVVTTTTVATENNQGFMALLLLAARVHAARTVPRIDWTQPLTRIRGPFDPVPRDAHKNAATTAPIECRTSDRGPPAPAA